MGLIGLKKGILFMNLTLLINCHIHAFFFAVTADFCASAAVWIIMSTAFGSTAAAGSGTFLDDI
jgi:hypothetical protein